MNIKNNGLNNVETRYIRCDVETRCIASLTNIYDPEKNIYNKKTLLMKTVNNSTFIYGIMLNKFIFKKDIG